MIQPGSPGMTTHNLFAEKSETDLSAIQLKLSPNPTRNILQGICKWIETKYPATISVLSPSGNLLSVKGSDNLNHVVPLDLSSLPGGAYIIKVVSADKILYKQFIKL